MSQLPFNLYFMIFFLFHNELIARYIIQSDSIIYEIAVDFFSQMLVSRRTKTTSASLERVMSRVGLKFGVAERQSGSSKRVEFPLSISQVLFNFPGSRLRNV